MAGGGESGLRRGEATVAGERPSRANNRPYLALTMPANPSSRVRRARRDGDIFRRQACNVAMRRAVCIDSSACVASANHNNLLCI